jgi:hypothetical protein
MFQSCLLFSTLKPEHMISIKADLLVFSLFQWILESSQLQIKKYIFIFDTIFTDGIQSVMILLLCFI